jgi:Precorrin-6B methylase 2
MNIEQILAQAELAAPSWTSSAERGELCKLASEVQEGGLIVEIGGLYGGMTAVLGLSNPLARIVVIDEFSWDPYHKGASAETLLKNVERVGVTNVEVITGDSRMIGKTWERPIDLLWIDGGHSYEFVRSDLDKFGPHAKRIALHDWDNPFWKTIHQAVEDFLKVQPGWKFDHSVEMVAVLERLPMAEAQMSEM